jgi:hypothetical protein
MSAPSPHAVAYARFWLLAAIRAAAVALLGVAAYAAATGAASLVSNLPNLIAGGAALLAGLAMETVTRIAPPAIVAAVLLRYDRRLVAFLAPSPGAFCQACGYPLKGLKFAICPECGLAATPAGPTSADTPRRPRPG